MAGQLHFKSGKTFRYQATFGDLVGSGAYGRVFTGHFKSNFNTSWEEEVEGRKAAIKRVEINFKKENVMDIEKDRELVALKELRHPCIVTLYSIEDDDNFRNFVFELCQANLEDFIKKKYKGVMPDEIEGLYQMASGLKFIHEKKMIHRDIKPENVLISSNGRKACLKIADFGFTKPLKEDGIHYELASGLKGTEYYMAPELLRLRNLNGRVLDIECTIASDVFAAGCTFFRYITGGLHPFGNGYDIEGNIVDGNSINVKGNGGEQWEINLINRMIQSDPENRPPFSKTVELLVKNTDTRINLASLPEILSGGKSIPPVIVVKNPSPHKMEIVGNNGSMQFDLKNVIGEGASGIVFDGTFNGVNVAVKRVQLFHISYNREQINNQLLDHPNIVQFIHHKRDRDFEYFVFELCAASLQDYTDGKYEGPIPTDEQVLFQLANGLEYIHSMGILHRGINPKNILISLTKPVQMKYCGFGNSKSLNERGTCSLSGIRGTFGWMSPEELEMNSADEMSEKKENSRVSITSDIFSAGCVFLFFLLRGKHPFGDRRNIYSNVFNENPVNVKELPEEHFARPFVIQMIEHDPEKRISLREVIEHLKPPSRLSLLQYDSRNLLCSTGTLSLAYRIAMLETPMAVKRVPLADCTTKSFKELEQLDHLNIVHFLHLDEDNDNKYFGMEWCVASLDKHFLPEDDPNKYIGPFPSDEQFCFQLISGLEYIHGEGLVHGSIKPTNILISSSKNPQIKLSDFGLTTTSRLNEGHTSKRSINGFLSSRYWLAPELLIDSNNEQNEPTKESDIFSAGSVFFYFLTKGCHLFGDPIYDILPNTVNGFQSNLFQKMPVGHFAMGLIRWMTQRNLEKRPKLPEVITHLKPIQPMTTAALETVGEIQISRSHFLTKGGYGSVYLGRCKRSVSEVVIKRIELVEGSRAKAINRELTALHNLDHPNIVRFFDSASTNDFIYIAMEKCLTSLYLYCRNPLLYHGVIPMPKEEQVLLQMAQGLHYIHSQVVNQSQPLIHRDVKPENILISCDNPAVIKWADFGLSRAVVTGSSSFTWSQLKGTERWLAPELIQRDVETKVRGSQSCDVFALGCVFFFYLKQGIHPFGSGDKHLVQHNIINEKPVNINKLSEKHFAFRIIQEMIQNDPHKRPKMKEVVDALRLSAAPSIEETRSVNSGSELASNSKRERDSEKSHYESSKKKSKP